MVNKEGNKVNEKMRRCGQQNTKGLLYREHDSVERDSVQKGGVQKIEESNSEVRLNAKVLSLSETLTGEEVLQRKPKQERKRERKSE